jgi:hypothetical protein
MDKPAVEWTIKARSDWRLNLVNSINAALPLATWRSKLLVGSRERAAKALGLGDLRLTGLTPSGHVGTLMGTHKVNIAGMALSRNAPGGRALTVLNLDTAPGEGLLREIHASEDIHSAQVIQL